MVSAQAHESCEPQAKTLEPSREGIDKPSSWPSLPACPERRCGEGTGLRPGYSPPRSQLVGVRQVGGGSRATPPPSLLKLSSFIVFATGCFFEVI